MGGYSQQGVLKKKKRSQLAVAVSVVVVVLLALMKRSLLEVAGVCWKSCSAALSLRGQRSAVLATASKNLA